MSDKYGPEFPDPHGKRAALREAERIMASVQQAKRRKSQAEAAAAKKAAATEQAELFPEAAKAAHHRMGANGEGSG